MKNIFKKLNTLEPKARASALMSRFVLAVLLVIVIAILSLKAFLWLVFSGIMLAVGYYVVKFFTMVRDALADEMQRDDWRSEKRK